MTIGERIKEQRILKGMTLLSLADAVSVSEATIQRYETGRIRNISPDMMQKLAEALGTTVAWLMGEREMIPANTSMVELSSREAMILKMYRDLPENERLTVQQTIAYFHKLHEQKDFVLERLRRCYLLLNYHGLGDEYEEQMAAVDQLEDDGVDIKSILEEEGE